MAREPSYEKVSLFKFKGLFPAVGLILFGAILMLGSNLLLTDKTKVAVQNAQTQAQTVKESSLCQDSPEEEEACVQSEKILENPTGAGIIPGPQGIQGSTGPRGPEGPIGLQGPEGRVGPKGEIGPIGPQGLQGFLGLQGAQGLSGPVPTAIDIQCSTSTVTVTLSNGTSFTGSVTCEKGEKGDKGDQGIEGPVGPVGPEGPEGPVGPQGPVGPVGPPAGEGGGTIPGTEEDPAASL